MNTSAVSKLLGVSSSTVQRWVKHLGLKMQRNEFGHYIYSEEDIEILKDFKQQIQSGIPIHNIKVTKKTRRGSMVLHRQPVTNDILLDKIKNIEKDLDSKADSVVTYQLLQHRREIEELKAQIERLNKQIEHLTSKKNEENIRMEESIATEITKRKKKTVLKSLLGFLYFDSK